MIKLQAKPAEPATLRSVKVINARQRLTTKVRARQTLSGKDFPTHWLDDDVRLTLWKHHDGKCCYCERKRDPKREPDIEHFRPKGGVTGVGGRNSGYWWLAYDWDNLFFACKTCNQEYKKNLFPLVGGKRARRPNSSLATELPLLIDPIKDQPEDLISYVWEFGKVPLAKPVGKDSKQRGRKTIEILGLDRDLLNDGRGRLLLPLRVMAAKMHAALHHGNVSLTNRTKRELVEATLRSNEFAGFRRAFFRAHGLGDYVAND
jgi:uncharacterized protein (TIGR02646 family)